MTASLPPLGTTSSSPVRSVARTIAAVLLAFACLSLAVPAAHAAGTDGLLLDASRDARPPRRSQDRSRTPRAAALRPRRAAHAPQHPAHAAPDAVPDEPRARALRVAAVAHEPLPASRRGAPRPRHGQPRVLRAHDAERLGSGRRARASGYVPRSARWLVGENIAWGVARAARPSWVVRAWMHSPPHRHNLLSRHFHDIGIGVARGVPLHGFRGIRLRATFSVEFGAHRGRTRCG